ncbi:MAG: ABC transporter permease [Solimonas sp.]
MTKGFAMNIALIFSVLKRQKTSIGLIAIEIALSCAIICNVLFLIAHRVERAHLRSGTAEDEIIYVRIADLNADEGQAQKDEIELKDIPGVKSATITNQIPFGDSSWNSGIRLDKEQKNATADVTLYCDGGGLLRTFGVTLVAGRDFYPSEYVSFDDVKGGKADSPDVTIITEALARKLFHGDNPLGKIIYSGDHPSRIIGIVERLVRPNFGNDLSDANAAMIQPIKLNLRYGEIILRTDVAERGSVLAAVKRKVHDTLMGSVIIEAGELSQVRRNYFRQNNLMNGILIIVIISLLTVTALGIVGLTSFWVKRRQRHIGIFRSLGATRFQILFHFQVENFIIVTFGIVLGMLLAYAISGWLMQEYELPRLPLKYLPFGAIIFWVLGQLSVVGSAVSAVLVSPALAVRAV